MRRRSSQRDASQRRRDLKLSKRHRKCKTCGKVFRYESKNVKRCQSCRQATAKWPRRCLPKLIENQDRVCPLCSKQLPEEISARIHIDHRWPKKFGGTDDYENLQAVHIQCNRRKNATIALEGYKVVKDILRAVVVGSRVSRAGIQSDSYILLDDNKRKPICRLWVNKAKVYLNVFEENEKEARNRIRAYGDICAFAEEIKSTTQRYLADEQ